MTRMVDEFGREVYENSFGENSYKHESYGMLGFYKSQSSNNTALFGSSIEHSNIITLVLKSGIHSRKLNKDRYYGDKTLFEVKMSSTQFAELISNMNCGDGVPVTITRKGNEMVKECPFENKAETHIKEFNQHTNDTYAKAQELLNNVSKKFSEAKTLNKKDKEEILSSLSMLANEIGSNINYQVKSFQEQIEKSTTEAKAEIEAFYQNRMLQIAKESLKNNTNELLKDMGKPVLLETEK